MTSEHAAALGRLKSLLPDEVILHVGMTKAGSTAIQNAFAKNSDFLLNKGVFFPTSIVERRNPLFPYRTAGHLHFFKTQDRLDLLIDEISAAASVRTAFFSAEDLFVDGQSDTLSFIRKLFSGKLLTLFCVVRPQADWLCSRYFESVVKGWRRETATFEDFVSRLIESGQLDYTRRLDELREVLGADAVIAADYEAVLRHGDSVRAALDVLKLEEELPLPMNEHEQNISRTSAEALEAHRQLNRLTPGLSKEDYLSWCARMEAAGATVRAEASPLTLPPELLRQVQDACREPNERLSAVYLGGAPFGNQHDTMAARVGPDRALVARLLETGIDELAPLVADAVSTSDERLRTAKQRLREGRVERLTAKRELHSLSRALASEKSRRAVLLKKIDGMGLTVSSLERKNATLESTLGALRSRLRLVSHDLEAEKLEMKRIRGELTAIKSRPLAFAFDALIVRFTAARQHTVSRAERRALLADPTLFDAEWYLACNRDVAAAKVDPLTHYLKSGATEGRDPSPAFSTSNYLRDCPDVATNGINPLVHFLRFGRQEGRHLRHTRNSAQKTRATQPYPIIRDLRAKLWGGFADVTIPHLIEIVEKNDEPATTRAAAAWELCRYYMSIDNIPRATAYIREARQLSEASMRDLRKQLVEIELLTMTGKFAEARARLADCSTIPANRSNATLSMANLINRESHADKSQHIVATINEMFEREGFSAITCGNGADKPLFAQLDCILSGLKFADEPQRISVLVPVFNAEQHIEVAVASLQKQTWRNLEIIVVDDASTDRTLEIATRIAQSDPRVQVIRNEHNLGAYPSRNRALLAATGDIVTVHDGDDWSHPEMLERQASLLLSRPKLRGTFSMMCRATADLIFQLRPARDVLEFIHRSYPSLMMRREDVLALGAWDGVLANADDEFLQRARKQFGSDAFADTNPTVPLSIFLTHDQSLTQSAETSLRSLTFGVRHEYRRSAAHWSNSQQANGEPMVLPTRSDCKTPFPCPKLLLPKSLRGSERYDLILISDLSLLGGTRSCNLGYIDTALAMGLRVGIFHWPRGDLTLLPDIAPDYRERNKHKGCTIITCEESVETDALIIHHPPILKYGLDRLPRVTSKAVYVLVNQLPRQVAQQVEPYYSVEQVDRDIERQFGHPPVWIPISLLTQRVLREHASNICLSSEIWYPPYRGELSRNDRLMARTGQTPVLGRHCRDHWTKWPGDAADIAAAYCAETSMNFRILGGARSALSKLGKTPSNWQIFPFDSLPIPRFLREIDFFVNFNNRDYIEEFGRNCMEAMAAGIPVIADPVFTETFGDAVLPTELADVQEQVRALWANRREYAEQAERGYAFVEANCGSSQVKRRLATLLNSDIYGES
jgi:glycosyltransferase involved in cell wall biosynthesis